MDRNTIVGFILLFALILGFGVYNSNQSKKMQEQRKQEMVEQMAQEAIDQNQDILTTLDSLEKIADTAPQTQNVPAVKRKPFSNIEPVDKSDWIVETEKAKYYITPQGGYITQIELKDTYKYADKDSDKQPLILFEGESSRMNMELMLRDQTVIQTKNYYFTSTVPRHHVVSDDNSTVSFRMHPAKMAANENDSLVEVIDPESYLEYQYSFNNNDYKMDIKVNFVNMSSYLYPTTRDFTFCWDAMLNNTEKNHEYEKNITALFYMDNLGEVDDLGEKGSDKKTFTTQIKWVAFKQQFFTSVLIAKDGYFEGGELKVDNLNKNETYHLKEMQANLDFRVEDLDNSGFDMSAYFGPNQYKLLKEYGLEMERMVPIGWGFFLLHWINRFAVIPLFNWLEAYGLSYGIIILILTVILKLILLPIAFKTYMSSARMRVLKPEIEEINNRYPKPDDMAKKQQATMTLYKSAGINPASGCLPMLLQMPILIAMFRFFPSAYELRQQPFLWADDLSTYDSILDFGFNIPFYGDHISLFTLLMTVATLVYTWLNNKLMAPTGNDQSQKMTKMMMYIMPIMFLGVFNKMPAALTYYYLLVNLITFLQMWIFRMAVNEERVHEQLKQNMKKPVKKSKWQAKMEEMAKQQAQLQKQQGQTQKKK
ncbi:membrane protein insertase YidC [Bacteroidales bacterium OttesenSCG-928-B11]|nr:membrane protein insertase YidC [Bacteroidales bacterium OttesenSCG-928-E04]MDL2309089.1 membrane protein insertase YidC [Bacteroidales bacterium OttesenSCG-928-C03]MDL2312198.1 membrane protein insertase YidC [Bacteroidales bacterium OttesenSCG-928-B11]MDL2326234.1 membrane protein insertase YidC [Bacteroidales bacterium OttesenSCG-928-A14]